MTKENKYRFLFAAGGTGGHLYPAIAVADTIKEQVPDAEILFVGTKDKIESKVIPQMGYDFRSIIVSGFSRKLTLKNLLFPFKLLIGLIQSIFICMKFKPTVAIGAGAYVSGPVVWAASLMGAKIMLLEQNSYPGITNRLLERYADQVHISFEDSKRYFRYQNKLHLTGNPLRVNLNLVNRKVALETYDLDLSKQTLLIIGGSLGAGSVNNATAKSLAELERNNIQVIWQTGERFFEEYKDLNTKSIKVVPFIEDVALAYSASDLVLARAGATTIAEAAMLGLAVIFVPSTNVADNHQYKNAKSLESENAACLLTDDKVEEKLASRVIDIINDNEKLIGYRENIKKFSKPDAAKIIAENAINFAVGED